MQIGHESIASGLEKRKRERRLKRMLKADADAEEDGVKLGLREDRSSFIPGRWSNFVRVPEKRPSRIAQVPPFDSWTRSCITRDWSPKHGRWDEKKSIEGAKS